MSSKSRLKSSRTQPLPQFNILNLLDRFHKEPVKPFEKFVSSKCKILETRTLESSSNAFLTFYQNLGLVSKNPISPIIEKVGEENLATKHVKNLNEYVNMAYAPRIKVSLQRRPNISTPKTNFKDTAKQFKTNDRPQLFLTNGFESSSHIILPDLTPTAKDETLHKYNLKSLRMEKCFRRTPKADKVDKSVQDFSFRNHKGCKTKLLDSKVVPMHKLFGYKMDIYEYIKVTEMIRQAKKTPFRFSH